jgi:hypothetical protein
MDQHLVTLPSICNNLFDAFSNCYRKWTVTDKYPLKNQTSFLVYVV